MKTLHIEKRAGLLLKQFLNLTD